MSVETLNYFLALGTLIMQIITVGFLAVYFLEKRFPDLGDISKILERHGLFFGFGLSVIGLLMTLYYSEILGFEPCFLCWWQRLCLYPQILILGLAVWKKELAQPAATYSLWLSIVGVFFAAYHHVLQVFPAGNLPCSATGPSCAKITFIEFGYVTFPMMAIALFAMLIVIMLFVRRKA